MEYDFSNKNIKIEFDPDTKDYTEIDYDKLDTLLRTMLDATLKVLHVIVLELEGLGE